MVHNSLSKRTSKVGVAAIAWAEERVVTPAVAGLAGARIEDDLVLGFCGAMRVSII